MPENDASPGAAAGLCDPDPDARAMARVAAGAPDAFDEIVTRHQGGLYNFFRRLGVEATEAEDLAQEVFLRIYVHAARYEANARFTTYLYKVARNAAIDHMRRRKRRLPTESLDRAPSEGRSPLSERLAAPPEDPIGAEAEEDKARQRAAVADAVRSLPEGERMVFVLSGLKNMRYADIAETLDIPVGTVKSRMHAAVGRLRAFLKRRGVGG